jgi:uncharacterized membrane protein
MSRRPPGELLGRVALVVSLGALFLAATATGPGRRLLQPLFPGLVGRLATDDFSARPDLEADRSALREEIRLVHEERMTARKERLQSVAGEHTVDGKRQYHRIALENRCRFTIAVALRYKDIDDATVSRGWWEVPAGGSTVTDAMTRDAAFWLYAENQQVGRTWDGRDTKDAVDVAVSNEKFDQVDGEPVVLKEPRSVSFLKRATGSEWTDATETFECPVEEAPPKGTVAKPPGSAGQGPRHP